MSFKKIIAMQVNEMISSDYISIYDYINNHNDKTIVIPALVCDEFDIDILYNELLSLGVRKEKYKNIYQWIISMRIKKLTKEKN
ncbi:MAG: hypothetical protein L6V91_08495 [Bacilli bacterium]|nr:MAG: hypothetical protein L6V91_08495 [Bacilli bacterium]